MFLYLLVLFVALPIIEFSLLFELADAISWPATIALVLLTGVLGAALARQQGLKTLSRIQQELAAKRMPGDALFDGALILVAGAVLITPGVLTDAFGFALLIPPIRSVIKRTLRRHFADRVQMVRTGAQSPSPGAGEVVDAQVIETQVRP